MRTHCLAGATTGPWPTESWTWHDKLPKPNSNNVMPRIKRKFGGAAAMASDAARPVMRCELPLEKTGWEKEESR